MVNAGAIVCTSLIKVKAVTLRPPPLCVCVRLRPVCVSLPLKPQKIPCNVGVTELLYQWGKMRGNVRLWVWGLINLLLMIYLPFPDLFNWFLWNSWFSFHCVLVFTTDSVRGICKLLPLDVCPVVVIKSLVNPSWRTLSCSSSHASTTQTKNNLHGEQAQVKMHTFRFYLSLNVDSVSFLVRDQTSCSSQSDPPNKGDIKLGLNASFVIGFSSGRVTFKNTLKPFK